MDSVERNRKRQNPLEWTTVKTDPNIHGLFTLSKKIWFKGFHVGEMFVDPLVAVVNRLGLPPFPSATNFLCLLFPLYVLLSPSLLSSLHCLDVSDVINEIHKNEKDTPIAIVMNNFVRLTNWIWNLSSSEGSFYLENSKQGIHWKISKTLLLKGGSSIICWNWVICT